MTPASKKIVVGDSDAIVLALICFILQRQGYDVEPIADREELLLLIRDGDYDALVVDAQLDGVLEIVKTVSPLRAGRVILTSRHEFETDAGIHAFLKKPLEFGQLIETVRDCVTQAE